MHHATFNSDFSSIQQKAFFIDKRTLEAQTHLRVDTAHELLHELSPLAQVDTRGRRLSSRADQEETGAGGLRVHHVEPGTELAGEDVLGCLVQLRREEKEKHAPDTPW